MTALSSTARGSGGRGGNRGGNRGGADQQAAPALTGLAKVQSELQTLVEKEDATSAEIKAKLTEYRKTREKIQMDLAAASAKLTAVLTVKQEATLVMMGTLD